MQDQYTRLEEATVIAREAALRGIDVRMSIISLGIFAKASRGGFSKDKVVSWDVLRNANINPLIPVLHDLISEMEDYY